MKQIGVVIGFIACVAVTGSVKGEVPIEPTNCRMSGEAELIATDFSTGNFSFGEIEGSASSGSGAWAHISPTTTWLLVPDNVTCRLNGIQIGNSTGTLLDTTFNYVLHIEDRKPSLQWFVTDIVASRNSGRGGVEWEDGLLELARVLRSMGYSDSHVFEVESWVLAP